MKNEHSEFTDDDLKRLKESLSGELPNLSYWAKSDLEVLKTLLARLEAAERALINSEYQEANEYFEQWRKAAGK